MSPSIALITILTDDVPRLVRFYQDVLGFRAKTEMGEYVEFESSGVRFAVCTRSTLAGLTHHPSYGQPHTGQAFELAFPLDSPAAVDTIYNDVVAKGATPIQPPADMPWGQRAAFFADPEGNIHELFAELPRPTA